MKPASTLASSSAADLAGKYEVFLSYRTEDTGKTFTDYLYHDLVGAGIRTFRDDNDLRIGKEFGPDLLKAIEDSKISIPIFSKNYAGSRWCLREFAHMVKCQVNEGRTIFPIFYDVRVSDVKNQTGSYETAFSQHKENLDKETVEDWRKALNTVGSLQGYVLETETHGREGELVKKLVKDVLLELKKNHRHVTNLVGMDYHVAEMTKLLQVDFDGVRIVGIHGMGGIGKTTIAEVIYNKLCDSFDCCCFLEDVRERAKQYHSGLVDLQKQLVSKILKQDLSNIVDVGDGIKQIKDAVHRKKVLIVLDDVDEKSQFDKLVGECNWFGEASRIIVTTRNKDVLNALEATCSGRGLLEAYGSYEPELMTDCDSLELFSQYAFMLESPPKDYLVLSKKVVDIAARLPLVLVTLGSLFLGNKDKDLWEEKLKELKEVPHDDVMGKLRVSFEALNDRQKQIFLDIACLFIGKDKAKPCYMWDDCKFSPMNGINTLVLRSLVKVGDDNRLRMHDQLRDLGRLIVQEENLYKLSRVWRPEEAFDVLEEGLGMENVEALNLDLRALDLDEYKQLQNVEQEYEQLKIEEKEYYTRRLTVEDFSRLRNLRFLRLGYVFLDLSTKSKNIFKKLRWLKWKCCGRFMQINLNLENLVILDLSNSTITDEWEGWTLFKAAKKLKILNLSGCMGLTRGPWRELGEVGGLGGLESLEHLDMRWCESMESLPDLSNLGKLKKLDLTSCKKLRVIEGLSGLVSLEILNIKSCTSIETLPDLSKLRMLKQLILNDCTQLREVGGLGGLESLEHLDMKWCHSMERLPDLSNLGKLKKVSLSGCRKLQFN